MVNVSTILSLIVDTNIIFIPQVWDIVYQTTIPTDLPIDTQKMFSYVDFHLQMLHFVLEP